jgi:hypothetical protein
MGSVANAPSEEAVDQPSVEERRALLHRIAASANFQRSARLRDFLLYVGRESLKDPDREIHEQEIGAKVFGRSTAYDRSQDNIVRVNATELRKRIEVYFATEGAHELLVLDIPRGAYKPIFHRRPPPIASFQPEDRTPHPDQQPALAPPRTGGTTDAVPSSFRFRSHMAWAAISLGLAVLCVFLWQQNRTLHKALNAGQDKPAVGAFWADFLRFRQQTDVVLPDDSVSLVEDITHRPISLSDYLNRNYVRQIQTSDISADRKIDLDEILNHNLITFGGVRAAQQVLPLLPASSSPHLTLSRFYVADAIKRNNVILIGGKKANPWVHLFDDRLNFITDYDDEHAHPVVRNLQPKPGEQAAYEVTHDPDWLTGYSVVAYLPNPSHTGNAIILAGTDSDATAAAAEFLTSEEQLEKFQATLHVQKLPYFEVLLKTSRLSGTSLSSDPIAFRTYPALR